MRLTPLAAAILAVLSLAACASSGTGAAAPPPAVVTPSTPAPRQADPPAVPAPSTLATAQGAFTFVHAYYAELNHAFTTNDDATFAGYSKPSCPCRKAIETIERNRREKKHWLPAAISVDDMSAKIINPVHIDVYVRGHWPKTHLLGPDNKTVAIDPAQSVQERFALDWNDSSWIISAIYEAVA